MLVLSDSYNSVQFVYSEYHMIYRITIYVKYMHI